MVDEDFIAIAVLVIAIPFVEFDVHVRISCNESHANCEAQEKCAEYVHCFRL